VVTALPSSASQGAAVHSAHAWPAAHRHHRGAARAGLGGDRRRRAWKSNSPGVTVTAAHVVEPHPDGSRLTLTLTVSGPLSGVGWLLTRSLTKRYVETEAASIRRAAETSTT
jgi:hypothetical protein